MAYVGPYLIWVIPALALVGCLSSESDTDLPTGPETILDLAADPPDDEGNLVIRNATGERIVLFRGEDRLKIIPDDLTDYLVEVPNPSGVALDLRIYLLSAIESVLDSPPGTSLVLKRWTVVLSTDTEEEHRSTWFIENDPNEADTGTLELRYAGGTDYSVDVYLNNRNGAKIASLRRARRLGR